MIQMSGYRALFCFLKSEFRMLTVRLTIFLWQDCGRLKTKTISLFSMMLLCKNDDLHNFLSVSIEFLKLFFKQAFTRLQCTPSVSLLLLFPLFCFFLILQLSYNRGCQILSPQGLFLLINEKGAARIVMCSCVDVVEG